MQLFLISNRLHRRRYSTWLSHSCGGTNRRRSSYSSLCVPTPGVEQTHRVPIFLQQFQTDPTVGSQPSPFLGDTCKPLQRLAASFKRNKVETSAVSCLMRCEAFLLAQKTGPNESKWSMNSKACMASEIPWKFLKQASPSLSTSLPHLCITCGKLIDIIRVTSTQGLSKSFHCFSLHNIAFQQCQCHVQRKAWRLLWCQSQ